MNPATPDQGTAPAYRPTTYGPPPDGSVAYPPPAVLIGPRPPTFLEKHWPAAQTAPSAALLAGCLGVGLLAAATLFAPRLGLQSGLIGSALAAVAVVAARREPDAGSRSAGTRSGTPASLARTGYAALAVALAWVPAIRDAAPTVVLSVLGSLALAVLAAADGRTWPAVLLSGPASAAASLRSLFWAGRRLTRLRRPTGIGAWLRGGVVGLVVVWVVGALLASADSAFAAVVDAVTPHVDLGSLPGRAVLVVVFTLVALTLASLAAAPPRWDAVRLPYRAGSRVEWVVPLVAVDVVLAAFVAVQATVMFAARPDALLGTGTTAAERARQGFGQLVAVTLITVALLAWAGRRAGTDRASGRRLLGVLGGGLVALVLVVVASALRRMALYEQAFGWTVLRIHVAAFEVWLAVVLVLCGVAWLLRRTDLVARGVVLAAGASLLVLNLASPDALAASANVDRFAATGKVDLDYLMRLSDDAVPALAGLPSDQWALVVDSRTPKVDPWYAVSVSRLRAGAVLQEP